jgi:tripartite-type tricarboxylate transporter receptor subunit TctC
MMDKAPFNVTKEFVPIGFLIEQPYVMAINASVPAATLAEFIKHAKSHPKQLNFGSGAVIAHVSQEVFYALAGLELTHIPYRGSAALMQSILSNETQVTFAGPGSVLPPIRQGRLKALAVTTLKRSREMPEVPTLSEQGFKGFEVRGWHGLLAPTGTPAAVVARLNQAVNQVLSASPAAKMLRDRGMDPAPASPEEFGRFLRTEEARWSAAIRKYNVKP